MNRETLEKIYKIYQKIPFISTDTRKDLGNTLFFALKGESFDANKFALRAIEKGAAFAIVDDKSLKTHDQYIFVDNVLECLQELAKHHRKQLNIPFICITGSNGKTTSKELISAVLNKKYNTFSTPGNLNNHIGVPLSLLQITSKHEVAVLEIGANHIGENLFLTEMALPTHGITTNIGKDHLGEFGGFQGVIEAYNEFIDYFNKNEKLRFYLNNDDPEIRKLVFSQNNMSYGVDSESNINGKINISALMLESEISFKENEKDVNTFIKSNLYGDFNIYNILGAFAIGIDFGIDPKDIKTAIENYYPKNNRSQLIEFKTNKIIFDAYNANPSSMMLAIENFNNIPHRKKY